MTDNSLLNFFKNNPFWAVFIIMFMVLPIVGAVIHILLKAFGKRGLDNEPSTPAGLHEDGTDGIPSADQEDDLKDPEKKK